MVNFYDFYDLFYKVFFSFLTQIIREIIMNAQDRILHRLLTLKKSSHQKIHQCSLRWELSIPQIAQFFYWKFHVFQPLKDIAVVNGQTARFECIVQSDPTTAVYWMKNNEVIENSAKTIIEFRNGVCRLTIPQAYQGKINLNNQKHMQIL